MKALWLFAAVVWALPITGHAQEQEVVVQGQAQEQEVVVQEVENDHVTCSLSGDPELSNFNFQKGNVPFPCFYHMADLRVEFNEDSSAGARGYDFFIIDVFTSADIETYGGRYFVGKVRIHIAGYRYISGTDLFDLIDEGTFKTSSSNVEIYLNSGQTPQDEADVWDVNSTFPNNIVRFGYDAAEEWAFLKLLRKNNPPVEIGFRPRDRNQGIPQTPKPGIVVQAKRGPLKVQPEGRFPYTLCSTKNDARTFRKIKLHPRYGNRLADNRRLLLYTAYTQTLNQAVYQTEPKCTDAVAAFRGCSGEAKRQQAISICSELTTARNVRCLERLAPEPGNALVAFTKCINVCCDVDMINSVPWLDLARMLCRIDLPGL